MSFHNFFFRKLISLKNKLQKAELLVHCLGFKKYDLIIYDDIYPHPVSGFRLEEFTVLLTVIEKSKILLSPIAYPIVNTPISLHPIHIKEMIKNNSQLREKLKLRKGIVNLNAKLFYCVFINNIYNFVYYLEKFKIPFVFTLYPGGGFQMNSKRSDQKLLRVLTSPMFRKVIVTQNITKDYLLSNQFCSKDQITLIFGGVVPQISLVREDFSRKNYLVNKETLDICFCAGKYMPQGIDKGYNVFIELAHLLAKKYDFVKFHVIGGFDSNDIDITLIKDKIVFYGYQEFENLESIFKSIDIIISPNKSFVLNEGSFDGFPLGTVIEAALNGVLAIISDDLNQNTKFNNKEELIITKSDCFTIEEEITHLIENPTKIIEIAYKGKLKFQEEYSNNIQMKPRIDLLKEIIEASK